MRIDLNADLGEGGSYDKELLSIVSSANISCGAHAGNENTISAAIAMASEKSVRIGAHPSYPDPDNFGRLSMPMTFDSLRSTLLSQLENFFAIADRHGVRIIHVKPHGALYNDAADDTELAKHFAEIVQEFDSSLIVIGLAGGALIQASEKIGLETMQEAFADRVYTNLGRLLSRSDPSALITDAGRACQQSIRLIREGVIQATDGSLIAVNADTICIHGDNPEALTLARALKKNLELEGIKVA